MDGRDWLLLGGMVVNWRWTNIVAAETVATTTATTTAHEHFPDKSHAQMQTEIKIRDSELTVVVDEQDSSELGTSHVSVTEFA